VGDALTALYHEENIYWCSYCSKGLFFPFACCDPDHRLHYITSHHLCVYYTYIFGTALIRYSSFLLL
jgi:hypothetical protein